MPMPNNKPIMPPVIKTTITMTPTLNGGKSIPIQRTTSVVLFHANRKLSNAMLTKTRNVINREKLFTDYPKFINQ